MEEEILTQENEGIEKDLEELEEEEIEKPKKTVKKISKEESPETPSETYEGFMQPARLGIVNTITGEIIEGFEIGKEEGVVQLGKTILNKLDKIAIASGA